MGKYKNNTCIICNVVFSSYNGIKRVCSNACLSEHKKAMRRVSDKAKRQRNRLKQHYEETIFSKHKEKYIDNIINYSSSPTGKAYIGFSKSPLMPVENGHGFMGVKLQSENRFLIQCSVCGKWLKRITAKHLDLHSMTQDEYKQMYGLNKSTALVSDVESNKQSLLAYHVPEFKKHIGASTNGFHKRRYIYKPKNTIEKQNENGTCPLQLKHNLIEYIKRFHRLPKANSTYNKDGFSSGTYKYRFGSLNNALKEYGLPVVTKIGSIYEYVFSDKTVYTHNYMEGGFEELYIIMLQKCPVLQ